MIETIEAVGARLRRYLAADLCLDIGEHDGMFVRGVDVALNQYLMVGRSAIEMIAQAMIIGGKPEIASVLDLPCGGGRVTRHLVKFLPEATIYVAELDKRNEDFVARTFGVTPIAAPADFSKTPPRTFDLVFVGSLLTHLPKERFAAALRWFTAALAPDGLLVATISGRRADHCERTMNRYIDPPLWDAAGNSRDATGFGYVETERNAAGSYGFSLAAPSWVLRLVETEPRCRILGFHEAAWGDHQDALILQRRALA